MYMFSILYVTLLFREKDSNKETLKLKKVPLKYKAMLKSFYMDK
jgi:hypothetical protein